MPAGTYTFTMYNITGSGNGSFNVDSSFTVTVFDSDDNLGVGDDAPVTETGAAPIIQSLGAGAPPGWNVGETFYFGGSRGIERGSPTDDFLVPKVGGSWETSVALYSLPGASVPLVVGQSYVRRGAAGNVNEEIVPCFAQGTRIETKYGEVAVEDLEVGDLVRTIDNGFKPLRWVGSKTVTVNARNAPIVFEKGAIGNHSTLKVSPNHRMLLSAPQNELLFGEADVLAPAKTLTMLKGVRREKPATITYVHILFDQHEIVVSNGAPTESFFPSTFAMSSLDQDSRDEVLSLFPELVSEVPHGFVTARMCVTASEATLFREVFQ